jgi:hypothetical protein
MKVYTISVEDVNVNLKIISFRGEKMKKLAILIGMILIASNLCFASEYETSKMEGGANFSEQQTDSKIDSASPVAIELELSSVEETECNAEAKNYNKLTTKTPPALDEQNTEAEEEGKTGEIVGASVGGVGAGLLAVAAMGAVPLEAAAVGTMVALGGTVIAVAAVGAAVGYGVVVGGKWLYNKIKK